MSEYTAEQARLDTDIANKSFAAHNLRAALDLIKDAARLGKTSATLSVHNRYHKDLEKSLQAGGFFTIYYTGQGYLYVSWSK